MFNEEHFEERNDWIIKTEDKETYALMNMTMADLALLFNDEKNKFILVKTLYDQEDVIIPVNRIRNIRMNKNISIMEKIEMGGL